MKLLVTFFYIFLYKTAVVWLLFLGSKQLSLRFDTSVWVVYGSFSLVGLVFFFQAVLFKKRSLFSRWSIWWLVFLEWLAVGMTGVYQVFFREASLIRVLWVVASLAPLHLFFFDVIRALVARWNVTYLTNLQRPSWFFEYSLEIPFLASVGFLVSYAIQNNSRFLLFWCGGLVFWLLLRHWIGGWLWKRGIKRLSNWLTKQHPFVFSEMPSVYDTNMLSPLVFSWQQYMARVKASQKELLWNLPCLSRDIQKKLAQDRDLSFGIEKPATVVAIRWKTKSLAVLQEYVFLQALAKMATDYVTQYDGFLFWEHDLLYVFFGFPYFYEHKNLLAVEFAQRMLSEIALIAQVQGIDVNTFTLVLSDMARLGGVPLWGEDFSLLFPRGKVFEQMRLIMKASEGIGIPFLIDKKVLEGLEARFFIQKTYKITIEDDVLILCKVVD